MDLGGDGGDLNVCPDRPGAISCQGVLLVLPYLFNASTHFKISATIHIVGWPMWLFPTCHPLMQLFWFENYRLEKLDREIFCGRLYGGTAGPRRNK